MEKIKPDITIVYEKYTEKAANLLSGGLANKYTCLVQKDTVFEAKKNEYTNNNRILFLSEILIDQYLSVSNVSDYVIDSCFEKSKIYFRLYSLGNWRGIWIDIEKTVKSEPRDLRIGWYYLRYFGDYLCYPLFWRKWSKDIEKLYYVTIVEFFLKEENIKLIISD